VTVTLAISEQLEAELRRSLDEKDESAAVLLCGRNLDGDRLTYFVQSVHWIPESSYIRRGPKELEIESRGWVPALAKAAKRGLCPAFFHTHPRMPPAPSLKDEAVDRAIAETFRIRADVDEYVSIILGGSSERPEFSGRVSTSHSPCRTIDRVRVVGRGVRFQLSAEKAAVSSAYQVFDRQIRAFGDEGQRLLEDLKVGVVGAGGTGSAVIEQLARLGIGQLVLIDDDVVDATNLTRIHESSQADIGEYKAQLAADRIQALGFGTRAEVHVERLASPKVLGPLSSCDLVFGCTDDEFGRVVLSRLAYWYLIGVFDVGVKLRSRSGQLSGIDARMTYIAPGEPCLLCRNRVDLRRASEEMLNPVERQALVEEGYAQGLADPDPAVVAYTTMIASIAVASMLERLFGFKNPELQSELVFGIHDWRVVQRDVAPREGHFCADCSSWGLGDQTPRLGMAWG